MAALLPFPLIHSLLSSSHRCWFDLVGVGHLDVVVDAGRADARLAGPRVDVGAGLAGAHVAHARLVPQIAYLRVVATLRTTLWKLSDV